MYAAAAILTTSGGRTSHAALVVRGWGKCCIVGCSALVIDYANRRMTVDGKTYAEGDWVTLNGTTGNVYEGKLGLIDADPGGNRYYLRLMKLADQRRVLRVRANADKGDEADAARALGAQGIGLVRTEHMFFDPERIRAMQELILAVSAEARRTAVMKLLPYQRDDFIRIFTAMKGLPVTIRLLDPPLHEFVPTAPEQLQKLAQTAGVSEIQLKARVDQLHETNPMLGHRGCRLGVSCPEITEMQSRAIFEAVVELRKRRVKAIPEVMIPLVGHINEFNDQARIIHRVAAEVMKETRTKFKYLVGTMIEVPRAALTAHMIATGAQFFSFGTNDLTMTTFGYSREDAGRFLPDYIDNGILAHDPFQSVDQNGVGQLVHLGLVRGRQTRKDLKVGVCGEHGGDPASVAFFHRVGLDYVSCTYADLAKFGVMPDAHGKLIEPPRKRTPGKAGKPARKKAKKVAPRRSRDR
jgi:pyruvate,orthophosphate dikinase